MLVLPLDITQNAEQVENAYLDPTGIPLIRPYKI